jgi:hypothetical protein
MLSNFNGCANELLTQFFGQSNQQALGATNVAQSIRVFVLNYLTDELCSMLLETGEGFINIFHGEHNAQVAQRIYWGISMIGNDWRSEKSRDFKPTMAVGSSHHGDLDPLIAQPSNTSRPFGILQQCQHYPFV